MNIDEDMDFGDDNLMDQGVANERDAALTREGGVARLLQLSPQESLPGNRPHQLFRGCIIQVGQEAPIEVLIPQQNVRNQVL